MKLIIKQLLTEDHGQMTQGQDVIKDGLRWWAALLLFLLILAGVSLTWLAPSELRIGSGQNLKNYATYISHWVELAAIGLICIGVLAALYTAFIVSFRTAIRSHAMPSHEFPTLFKKEEIAGSLTLWLLLGLEFAIAADIIKTAVDLDRGWDQLGKLAAIVAIRAFLGYMLQIDLEKPATSKQEELPEEGEQRAASFKPAA